MLAALVGCHLGLIMPLNGSAIEHVDRNLLRDLRGVEGDVVVVRRHELKVDRSSNETVCEAGIEPATHAC